MDAVTRFADAATQWYPQRPSLPAIDRLLNGDMATAKVVKQNSKRTVYAVSDSPGAPPAYFVKYTHPKGVRDRMKGLVRSKTNMEYDATMALLENGVPAVKPVASAWLGIQGLLITEAIPDTRPADELWHDVCSDAQRRTAFLRGLHTLLKVMLDGSVRHPDLHLGNVLCQEGTPESKFFLVDSFGVRCGSGMSERHATEAMLLVSPLRRLLTLDEREAMLMGLPGISGESEDLWRRIARGNVQAFYERWSGRKKKLVKGTGHCDHGRTGSGRWIFRNGFDVAHGDAIVAEHVRVRDESPEELLKSSRKRCVSKVTIGEESYVVKEFRNPGSWGRFSADARSWIHNWGLEMCGLRVATCHGWLRTESGSSFLVFDFLDGEELFDVLKDGRGDEALYRQIYDFVCELYLWRIEHEDLKITNFIYRGGQLWLIDNDAVLFDRRIGTKQWERNRRHLLRGRDEHDFLGRLADWIDAQPPPYTCI